MPKSIKQLLKENEKLKNIITARLQKEDAIKEQNRLLKQNKQLLRQIKFKKTLKFAKGAERVAVGTGKVGINIGKSIFRGLQKLEQQRLRNEAANRKLSRAIKLKKPISKVKKVKRRRRR